VNIILQHWTGELDELGKLSSANISSYAKRIGAEYRLLRGNVFRPNLAPPCQKLYMLDAAFDGYDLVVMLDMDMFAVTGLDEDVFALGGTGLFSTYTAGVFERCRRQHPSLTSKDYAYWGGAIWLLSLERRQALRAQIVEDELASFSGNYNDEGIMHRLAMRARIRQDRIPDRWCQCSYLPKPKDAAMIHVRTKVTPEGPKATKLANYRSLKGVIE
jgi:hypothetical protein